MFAHPNIWKVTIGLRDYTEGLDFKDFSVGPLRVSTGV